MLSESKIYVLSFDLWTWIKFYLLISYILASHLNLSLFQYCLCSLIASPVSDYLVIPFLESPDPWEYPFLKWKISSVWMVNSINKCKNAQIILKTISMVIQWVVSPNQAEMNKRQIWNLLILSDFHIITWLFTRLLTEVRWDTWSV